MNHKEAVAASHARDNKRLVCRFCGRKQADQIDCNLFDEKDDGPSGGERPDLCWDIAHDDQCARFQELHSVIDDLRSMCISAVEIMAAVERAMLPNAGDHRAGEDKP
jgi:hypothetical protein